MRFDKDVYFNVCDIIKFERDGELNSVIGFVDPPTGQLHMLLSLRVPIIGSIKDENSKAKWINFTSTNP